MATRSFTDRTLRSLKPAPATKRYEVFDRSEPRFGVRVGDGREITFILYTRINGVPTRRKIGRYPGLSLADARARASAWIALIEAGQDPAVVEADRQAEEKRRTQLADERNFAAVFAAFKREKLSKERQGSQVAVDVEREFLPRLGATPIDKITRAEVRGIIEAKAQDHPAMARNLLTHIKRLMVWAVDTERYGMESSPLDRLKANKVIGEKIARRRILNDDELRALWRAAGKLQYPLGPFYRLLMLTGLRLNELARARWDELRDGVLTVPPERMKGRPSKAQPHAVPLSGAALEIVEQLPRFSGPYLFTIAGTKPVWIGSDAKARVDALMRENGSGEPWRNHDVRRTVRTRLSALRIDQRVAEAVLGHVPPGVVGVYDQHDFIDEKRAALEQWARHLQAIVEPRTGNVIEISARA
jgi:integrase